MQVDLRIPSLKGSFFKLAQCFFLIFFKYHVVFQDQAENYLDKDDIIDMIGAIAI